MGGSILTASTSHLILTQGLRVLIELVANVVREEAESA